MVDPPKETDTKILVWIAEKRGIKFAEYLGFPLVGMAWGVTGWFMWDFEIRSIFGLGVIGFLGLTLPVVYWDNLLRRTKDYLRRQREAEQNINRVMGGFLKDLKQLSVNRKRK